MTLLGYGMPNAATATSSKVRVTCQSLKHGFSMGFFPNEPSQLDKLQKLSSASPTFSCNTVQRRSCLLHLYNSIKTHQSCDFQWEGTKVSDTPTSETCLLVCWWIGMIKATFQRSLSHNINESVDDRCHSSAMLKHWDTVDLQEKSQTLTTAYSWVGRKNTLQMDGKTSYIDFEIQ